MTTQSGVKQTAHWQLLRHPAVALLLPSNALASAGNSVYIVATGWLAYEYTGSATAVGGALSIRLLPLLLFAPLAGVLIDRYDRKALLIGASLFLTAVSVLLTILVATKFTTLYLLLASQFLIGMGQVVRAPVRRAVYADILPPGVLLNALAIDRTAFEGVRLVSPLLIAAVLANLGASWAFALQVIFYLLAALLMWPLRVPIADRKQAKSETVSRNVLEGVSYLRQRPELGLLLCILLSERLLGPDLAFYILPVFSAEVLAAGPEGVGWLLAAAAVGGILGTTLLSLVPTGPAHLRLPVIILLGMGAALFGFGFTTWLPIAMLAYLAVSVTHSTFLVSVASATQVLTNAGFRGRVGTLMSTVEGLAAAGGLVGGLLADLLGTAAAIKLSGMSMLLSGIAAYLILRRMPIRT